MENRLKMLSVAVWIMFIGVQLQAINKEDVVAEKTARTFYEKLAAAQTIPDKISAIGALLNGNSKKKLQSDLARALSSNMPTELKGMLQGSSFIYRLAEKINSSTRPSVSPNGQYLNVVSDKKKFQIWDIKTGLKLHESDTQYLSSPDDNYVAYGKNGDLIIWDIKARQELHRLKEDIANIYLVKFSKKGSYCLVLYKNKSVKLPGEELSYSARDARVLSMKTGKTLLELSNLEYYDEKNLFRYSGMNLDEKYLMSLDEKYLVVEFVEGSLGIYDTKTMKENHRMPIRFGCKTQITSDNKLLIVDGYEILVWDLNTGSKIHEFTGIDLREISSDGNRLLVVAKGKFDALQILDVSSGQKLFSLPESNVESALSPDGNYLATYKKNGFHVYGNADIWNTTTGKKECELVGSDQKFIVKISFDNKFAVGVYPKPIASRVWNIETGLPCSNIVNGYCISINKENYMVILIPDTGVIEVWHMYTNLLDQKIIKNLTLEQMILLIIYADAKTKNLEITFSEVKKMFSDVKNQEPMMQEIFNAANDLSEQLKVFMGIPTTTTAGGASSSSSSSQ